MVRLNVWTVCEQMSWIMQILQDVWPFFCSSVAAICLDLGASQTAGNH